MKNSSFSIAVFKRLLAGSVILAIILMLVIYFFPWDVLRAPINRYVSGKLGRHFEITQRLSVQLGRTTSVTLVGVEIANPDWARDSYFLKATTAQFDISLLPLLSGKVVLPQIKLTDPKFGLQVEPDGRRTWAFSRDTSDSGAVPQIGSVVVNKGSLSYFAKAQGADLDVQFSLTPEAGNDLPLSYKAAGRWRNGSFVANGRTGGVLEFSRDTRQMFPIEVNAVAGKTSLNAKGSITDLANLAGIDANFDLQGQNLDDLYGLLGVVLPSTPPFKFRGKLDKRDKVWSVTQLQGLLGKSDLSGALSFDQSSAIPLLKGKLQSKVMDFADLGPVIGIGPSVKLKSNSKAVAISDSSKIAPGVPNPKLTAATVSSKVLPRTPLDIAKIKSMNADVTYSALDIRHVKELPLDKGSVHVKLNTGVLLLEPISLGVAGGSVAGTIRIDANSFPVAISTRLDVRALQLNQLFPTVKTTKSGLGKISGQFDLKGRGNSVAQMLGSASGDVAVLMGRGEVSNILLEFLGLDGGEIIKFLMRGDNNVQLRCAAAAFDVKNGLMTSRAIVLDTSDTVITGQGSISLANETLDIVLKPQPKDMSILSLRSPLKIGGTFADMSAGPDKAALAGRAGLALVLAAINPLLALAATIETGPGGDADCAAVLSQAALPKTRPSKK